MLGMTLFLCSLGMLFAATIIGYLVVRLRADAWRPPGAEHLPTGMWIGTVLLVACSLTVHLALVEIRKGDQRKLLRWLLATVCLGVGFIACQSWNWIWFYRAGFLHAPSLYGFTFYMLTGLHGAHVLGGLIGLGWVTARAWLGHYSWAYYPGVLYNTVYWHFLDGTWLILLAVLLIGSS
jgi:cytochrome c oxidase subunit 3